VPERSPTDRFSTTSARLRALGRQAQAQVYRASGRRPPGPPRRSRFTGRAAVLALVLCALVVALAYPTRQYIAQRSDIAEQREQAEQARKRVEELREEKARWQDPNHVKAEARERLHFVMPGETGYKIVAPEAGLDVQRSSARAGADRPWYGNLWAGVDAADTGRRR
jgi:cell division protein FtsB